MNQRMKEIRKHLKISQDDFGRRVGVTGSQISRLESGVQVITSQMMLAICREFHISEEWLRTGQGKMFIETPTFSLDEYAVHNELTSLETDIIKGYMSLDKEMRQSLIARFKKIFDEHPNELNSNKEVEMSEELSPSIEPKLTTEDEKELELIRQEMLAEKKGRTSSASISAKDA